jgi:Mn2+/Fe2+ NRAMP family transporter
MLMAFVKKINISSEAKSMGIDFYVPFLIILIAILYTCFSPDLESLQYISRIIEFVVCPIAAWWSVYLFLDHSVDKDKTAELTPNFSTPILSYGLIRVTSFLFF